MNTKPHNRIKALISELGITEASFFAFTGLSHCSLYANENDYERKRIDAILSIFTKLKAWFDSPDEAWAWYTKQRINGFGNLTAADLVVQNQSSGASTVIDYIRSKQLGGFE